MRIALFGGSFDPPHRGHLAAAQAAADAFALDRIYVAPTGRQPLKFTGPQASFEDRLAMTQLLCKEDPRLVASSLDYPHPDGAPNYTVDLLQQLRTPEDTLFNIVGADSFLDLRYWREPERLLTLAEWIVLSRPGFSLNDLEPLALTLEQRKYVHLLQTVHVNIAATDIRSRLSDHDLCADALTPAVENYIKEHRLYLDGSEHP